MLTRQYSHISAVLISVSDISGSEIAKMENNTAELTAPGLPDTACITGLV